MFRAILTYFAVKKIVTFVVLAAMMIGLLAVSMLCSTTTIALHGSTRTLIPGNGKTSERSMF